MPIETVDTCITAVELCDLSAKIYNPQPGDFDVVGTAVGIVYGVKTIRDNLCVVPRGSKPIADWLRDFEAIPWWYTGIGIAHSGMHIGVPELVEAVKPLLTPSLKLVWGGHSLGGGHARQAAATCIAFNIPVGELITFAAPKPGSVGQARILQKYTLLTGMQDVNYRNRRDIVPEVPGLIPPLSEFWVHSVPPTPLDCAPAVDDFEDLRDHHVELYLRALTLLTAMPASTLPLAARSSTLATADRQASAAYEVPGAPP
jgi:hypothetical protein